jgi:hypothetical protein
MLGRLRKTTVLSEAEFLRFIDLHAVVGRGLGFVDIHLLAAARSLSGTVLWSKDKRRNAEAQRLSIQIETEK